MANRPGFLLLILALVGITFVPLAVLWVTRFGVAPVAAVVGGFLLLQVALPAWTYRDARPRGSGTAARWAAVVFLLPAVGIALYLLVREAADRMGAEKPEDGSPGPDVE